jgi:hypothetical protein
MVIPDLGTLELKALQAGFGLAGGFEIEVDGVNILMLWASRICSRIGPSHVFDMLMF